MDNPKIYLAGPVAHSPDAVEWRDNIKSTYADRARFLDPLEEVHATGDLTPAEAEHLVQSDKELLREADGVLVGYTPVRSIGTPMECMWAYERHKPVVLWLREGSVSDLSPWYRYHAGVADDASRALDWLLGEIAHAEVLG